MSIVIIKTLGGDELLGTDEGNNQYSRLRVLHVTDKGMALIPWLMCSPDAKVTLDTGIMAKIPAPIEIEKEYLKTVSGLLLS